MPYVERRAGLVVGVYENLQAGYAEEFLADNDAEVLAYLAPETEPERQPGIVAQVRLKISDNIVQSVSTDGGLSNCVAFEPGVIWCEFPSPVEGEYLVWPSNGATHRCYSLADEQLPEGFAVRSETYGGEVEFPECIQILVTKS